jgi:starch phosphorylase
MKLSLNGALTIGTLDGANIEIRDAVGPENFFLFGLDAAAVLEQRRAGAEGRAFYEADETIREAVDLIRSGFFSPDERDLFTPLIDGLLGRDEYLSLADFAAYAACQRDVAEAYRDEDAWSRKAALNIARVGAFSSDRTVREYAREIWKIDPVEVQLDP